MATISWTNSNGNETKKHIHGGYKTLCGIEIPSHKHDYNVFGIPECKRCIKQDKSQSE